MAVNAGPPKAAAITEGESQAIDTVFRAIHAGDPDPKLLSYQYLQMLPQLAQGEANKIWVIPTEFTRALGQIGGVRRPSGRDARDARPASDGPPARRRRPRRPARRRTPEAGSRRRSRQRRPRARGARGRPAARRRRARPRWPRRSAVRAGRRAGAARPTRGPRCPRRRGACRRRRAA